MDDIGVLNSWVMLLMKSFFISVSFFCLNATMMVYTKIISNMSVNANAGTMNEIELKM